MSELSSSSSPVVIYPEIVHLDRASVIARIRLALRARSGLAWSVRGGVVGELDYGRLVIAAPPERRSPGGGMTAADRADLARLLGLAAPVGPDGYVVPDATDQYRAAIDRAEGRAPRVVPQAYPWD